MYYGARYYLPSLRRFISADTIVPGAGNPQALNRYAYVLNSPLNLIDPTGNYPLHGAYIEEEGFVYVPKKAPYQPYKSTFSSSTLTSPTQTVDQGLSEQLDESGSPEQNNSSPIKELKDRSKKSGLPVIVQLITEREFIFLAGCFDSGFCGTPASYHDVFFTSNYTFRDRLTAAVDVLRSTAWPLAGMALFGASAPSEMFPAGTTADVMSSTSGIINITDQGLTHVLNDHTTIGGPPRSDASVFFDTEDVRLLINEAENAIPVQQSNGRLEYVVDAGRMIGYDSHARGAATQFYTVITKPNGDLVTAFPGLPDSYYGSP